MLFDVVAAPKKSIKVIKDHHKQVPIVCLKFCDWQNDSSSQAQRDPDDSHAVAHEDKKAWMFISIDAHGRVIINSITKILFVLKATKHIIIDPIKYTGSPFTSVSPRFKSLHGYGIYDDVPLVALAN